MTSVNTYSTTHSGTLVTSGGDSLEIDLELIGGRTLRMSTAGEELGAWPIDDCSIEPTGDGAYRLVVDGDDAQFRPDDAGTFRGLVSAVTGEAVGVPDPEDDGPSRPASRHAADDPVAFLFGAGGPPLHRSVTEATPGAVERSDLPRIDDVDEPAEADLFEPRAPLESPRDPVAADAEVPVVDEPEPTALEPEPTALEPEPTALEPEDLEPHDPESGGKPVVGGLAPPDPDADDPDLEHTGGVDRESYDRTAELVIAVEPLPHEEGEDADADVEIETEPVGDLELEPDGAGDDLGVDREGELDDKTEGAVIPGRVPGGKSALDRLAAAISALSVPHDPSEDEDDVDHDDDHDEEVVPGAVAEGVLETQRMIRIKQTKATRTAARLRIAMIAVGAVAIIALFAFLTPRAIDFIRSYEGGPELPPTLPVSETTLPPATTTPASAVGAPSTTVAATPLPAGGTIFDVPSPEFVERWNATGGPIDDVLTFRAFPLPGPFEERFTAFLALQGVVEADGTMGPLTLIVDPSGPSEYDRLGIQAMGVAIATADPARSPDGRATLLGQLGLNVRQPLLEGIDGTVTTNGLTYTLFFDSATTILTMTIGPAG